MEILVVSPARPDEQTLNPGINYYTQKARLIHKFTGGDGVKYYNVSYITDIYGRNLPLPIDGIVTSSSVRFPLDDERNELQDNTQDNVQNNVRTSMTEQTFYHRDQVDQLTAVGFVDITGTDGLRSAGRIPLGTGIYGKYFFNEQDAVQDMLPGEAIYRIDASECYPLVDEAHGDLLVLASIFTNRYIAATLRTNDGVVSAEQLQQLITLWKMVFARTGEDDKLSLSDLEDVINVYSYIIRYRAGTGANPSTYLSADGRPLWMLPINAIMAKLGYHGIFATDSYNNSRDRGCVSYNINPATAYQVGHAQY